MTFFRAASYGSPGPGPTERGPSLLYLSVLGALGGWLLSCAAQAPPQPPRLERPQAITNLTAHQVGQTIEIRFTLPTLATDGERLTKPLEVWIFRAPAPAGAGAASSPPPAQPMLTAVPGPLGRFETDHHFSYALPLAEPDYLRATASQARFVVYVETVTRGFGRRPTASAASNSVALDLLDVSPPPTNLKVQTTEHALILTWTPPAESLSARPLSGLAGYRVGRSDTGKPGTYELRGEALSSPATVASTGPAYSDGDFQFGRTYYYQVRALFKQGGQEAESADSVPVAVTPRDVFPPAAPAALTALYAPGVVELIWNANAESDLAGYNVYRRESSGEFRRLNPSLVPTPIYRDSSTAAGQSYSYRVTAVDRSGNESAPSAVAEVKTE